MTNEEKMQAALAVVFDSDAGDGLTVRGYLRELLLTLWEEGEGFSGKRPFGNSGWEYELYAPLVKSGFVSGELDEDGYIDSVGHEGPDFVAALICYALRDPDAAV